MATLAIVERDELGELNILRSANKSDLLNYHPRCGTCEKGKGIHGQEGLTMLFCQWAHKPVEREGYCSNHTELTPIGV
jgi:hypothetical protein